MKVDDDGRTAGPRGGAAVRVLVPGAGRPEPGADRGIPRPPGAADGRRGDRRRRRVGAVDRVAALEDPRRGAVRARRAGRQCAALPDQRGVCPVLPVGRRRGDGQPRTGTGRGVRVRIRPMADRDADAVLRIYQVGLDTGDASFEVAAPGWAMFDAARLPGHRYVAVDDGGVLGWV